MVGLSTRRGKESAGVYRYETVAYVSSYGVCADGLWYVRYSADGNAPD